MTGAGSVRVLHRGPRMDVRFAAPARRNPLSAATRAALEAALREAAGAAVRVVTLAGAPHDPPVFAAGADLREVGALEPVPAHAFAEDGQRLMRLIEDHPALVLALVDGPCMGGALDLALACDVVACSSRSTFAHPGARLGIVTGWGGTRRLPRAVGEAAAAGILATGRTLAAGEARRLGLVRHVWPDASFAEEAEALAAEWTESLLRSPPERVRLLKRAARSADTSAEGPVDSAVARLLASDRGAAPRS